MFLLHFYVFNENVETQSAFCVLKLVLMTYNEYYLNFKLLSCYIGKIVTFYTTTVLSTGTTYFYLNVHASRIWIFLCNRKCDQNSQASLNFYYFWISYLFIKFYLEQNFWRICAHHHLVQRKKKFWAWFGVPVGW